MINTSQTSSSELIVEDIGVSNVFYLSSGGVGSEYDRNPLFLISFSNDNNVYIYSLDDGIIKQETKVTLNSLIPYEYKPNRKFLKVISEKPIMIYQFQGKKEYETTGGTYYPAVTGKFSGKNFVVFPLPSFQDQTIRLEIWALETGVVDIKNESNVISLPVFKDTYSNIVLPLIEPHQTYYNVTSTANIMISTSIRYSWLPTPSTNGLYVGKVHIGNCREYHEPNYGGLVVLAYEPGVVNIINFTDGSIINQIEFTQAGEIWGCGTYLHDLKNCVPTFDNAFVKVEGEIDTFVQIGASGGGQSYVGGRITEEGEIEYWIWVVGENHADAFPGVIFAPEDITFTLNDSEITMKADEYMLLNVNKIYHVISTKPLVIQNPSESLTGFVVVPSGIPSTRPEVTEEEPPPADKTMIYVSLAVAAIVVLVALGYFIIRKKR